MALDDVIERLLHQSEASPESQSFQPAPAPAPADDGRIACRSCSNLEDNGSCLAGRRGQLEGVTPGRAYRPLVGLLRRCEGFAPHITDEDQRTGAERWPWPQ